MKLKIYHNPRCRKSRETLQILTDNNETPEIVLYLENPPTKDELKSLLKKLKIPAAKLIRKTEVIFKENYKGKELTEEEWIDAMVKFPKLIERPIVIKGNKAVLGRPPENVLSLV
jgi:arsenate reductase